MVINSGPLQKPYPLISLVPWEAEGLCPSIRQGPAKDGHRNIFLHTDSRNLIQSRQQAAWLALGLGLLQRLLFLSGAQLLQLLLLPHPLGIPPIQGQQLIFLFSYSPWMFNQDSPFPLLLFFLRFVVALQVAGVVSRFKCLSSRFFHLCYKVAWWTLCWRIKISFEYIEPIWNCLSSNLGILKLSVLINKKIFKPVYRNVPKL